MSDAGTSRTNEPSRRTVAIEHSAVFLQENARRCRRGPRPRRVQAEANAAVRNLLEYESSFAMNAVRRVAGELEPAVFLPLAEAWRELGLPE
jgi:hypothetical protein